MKATVVQHQIQMGCSKMLPRNGQAKVPKCKEKYQAIQECYNLLDIMFRQETQL
jgi:hypothetical protein